MRAKLYESQGDPWLTAILVLFLITTTAIITTVMACGLHLGSKRHINSNYMCNNLSGEKQIPMQFDLDDEESESIYHSVQSLVASTEKV
ncbi:hypothetical protein Ciccas_006888 [Cichlidogyrus casuarinus]|uniref:Uncharacterized protein n=1 Tax=Cichlidogyrus casuarinus TaxID=1844966 RepID=A0ABD2Q4F2_9PLAT